jgi:SAM-dependent methyltransferase
MSGHDHGPEMFDAAFWDARYSSAHALWSGNPNHHLVAEVGGPAGLAPGTALDAGAGEGADAIWLAERGWQVTAVDVSGVALGRAAEHAAKAGDEVAARIRWLREDLIEWAPPGRAYDLVTSQYIHLPGALRHTFFARLAAAVRDGGTLLIVGHRRTRQRDRRRRMGDRHERHRGTGDHRPGRPARHGSRHRLPRPPRLTVRQEGLSTGRPASRAASSSGLS